MVSRPAFAALGCLHCRSRVLKAITSNSAPFIRAPAAATSTTLRQRNLHRSFSSLPSDTIQASSESKSSAPSNDASTAESSQAGKTGDDTPWFLQVEPPRHAPTQHVSPLPELPDSPPPILEPLMKYVYEEMGLDDLSLLDLRALDPPPALGPNLLILFATARSERHLHVSSSRLVKWLRHTHRIESKADGLIGPGELKTKLRRLRRKAKLLGSAAVAPGDDDGITTGWICINLGTRGATLGEASHFDADGKMSGFGAPVTGSTVVVQVMTESRRDELQLERLWSQLLIRSEAQAQRLAEGDVEFHSRFGKLPPTTVRSSKGNSLTPTQRRGFSTCLQRPASVSYAASLQSKLPNSSATSWSGHAPEVLAAETRQEIEQIRWEGQEVDKEHCLELLMNIFRTPSTSEHHSQQQADLATELIETMSDRGMPVMDHETLITLIEAIALSGAKDGRIQQIQSNLELVLLRTRSCPTQEQLSRLLLAYASQQNWEMFWETWRIPARYSQRRSPSMYQCMYSTMSQTHDKAKCIDALRNCVPEMLAEEPPVMPTDAIWPSLKACIQCADPSAVLVAERIMSRGVGSSKRPVNTEFVRMLKELEALRRDS